MSLPIDKTIDRIQQVGDSINIRVTYANAKRMALRMLGEGCFSDNHIKGWIEYLKGKRWDFD
jgi:hypothetical protein